LRKGIYLSRGFFSTGIFFERYCFALPEKFPAVLIHRVPGGCHVLTLLQPCKDLIPGDWLLYQTDSQNPVRSPGFLTRDSRTAAILAAETRSGRKEPFIEFVQWTLKYTF